MSLIGLISDIVLLTIAAFLIIYYRKKGFVASIIGFGSLIISVFAAIVLSQAFAAPIAEKLGGKIKFVSAEFLSKVIAFACVFIVSFILLKVLTIVLSKIIKSLPVIGKIDTLLGMIIGIIAAIIWVQILSMIIITLGTFIAERSQSIADDAFTKSILTNFMYKLNLFKKILGLIKI